MTPDTSPSPLPRARLHASLRYAAIALAYWGLYLIFSAIASFFTAVSIVSVWFLPPGLSMALLLLMGPAAVPLVLIAEFFGSWLIWHFPLPVTLLSMLTVGGGYSIGGLILRRVLGGANLRRGLDVMRFIGISTLTSFGVAASTVAVFASGGLIASSDYALTVYNFWIGDTIGIFLVTPFILVIAKPLLAEALRIASPLSSLPLEGTEGGRTPHAKRRSILRPIWLTLAAVLLGFLLAWPPTRELHLYYLCFVGVIWVAWNDGLRGAVIGAVAINATARVVSLIAPLESSYEMAEMQIFSIALSAIGLTLGAMSDGRRELERQQKEFQATLLHRADELAALHAKAARLLESERDQRAMAESLRDVAMAFSANLEMDELFEHILINMKRVVPHDRATLMLLEEGIVHVVKSSGYVEPELLTTLNTVRFRLANTPTLRKMAETGQPTLIADVRADPDWTMVAGLEWIRSYAGAPILLRGRAVGFLNLDSDTVGYFKPAHLERLRAFAAQAAMAFENSQLYQSVRQNAEEASLLYRASANLFTRDKDLSALAAQIAKAVVDEIKCDHCGVLLIDEDQTNAYLGGQAGIPSIGSPTVISLGGRSVIPTAVREARPIYVPDVSGDPRYLVGNLDTRSELAVPLIAGGLVIGVLNLESTRLDGFDERTRRTVFAFAERAALALDDARLFAETTMHARHAAALNDIARIGLEQSDLDTSLRLFSTRLVSLFSADACFIKRWGAERWESSLALAASSSDDYVALYTNMDDMALAENVLRLGNAIAIDNIFDTPFITPRLAASIPARSLLIAPLIAGNLQLGAAFIAFHTHHHFSAQEIARAEQAAANIALAMAKARLLDETQQRARELEALSRVSLALRVAPARARLVPLVLEQASAVLGAQGAALAMHDPVAGNILIELGTGVWSGFTGMRVRDDEGVTARIIHSREPYLNNQFHTDEEVLLTEAREGAIAAAGAPLVVQDRALGVLWIASKECLTESQMRLLTSIADIAASALHRADLHEKTTRRMQWFSALHDIDMAIGATLDLDVILDVLLYQVTTQLGVSAADILLLDPNLQLLEYAAGRGFRTTALRHTRLRLGEGLAGRAALERVIVSISNLRDDAADLTRAPLLSNENFVAYYGVPLVAKGHMRGVLEIFHRSALGSDPEWLSFLEALAAQTAIAIDNAALFSELQRSVEALQSTQAQLVRAARFTAVGELAAGVAHQINNPLTTVIADAQLMLKATPSDSPIHPSAQAIFQAGWRAQRVVQRLMNFSRPDDGELVPTDVNETVMEALDLVGAHLTRGGADLRVELAPDLPHVPANGHQLEEIWVNLLMNARDALADDRPGVVIVSSRVSASDDMIEVSVADNGRGISEADARQIFTPFFTTKEGGRGNGLGLSVCQTIAHNHGGDITFESALGQGTKFIVRIPRRPLKQAAPPPAEPGAPAELLELDL